MKEKNKIIPKSWQIKPLGEVCKLKNGYAFKSDNYLDKGIPVIRISDIKDGLIVPRNTVHVSENSIYDSYIIDENEIIVAMSGATTGKFGIYKSKEKAYQNQRVGKFDIIDKTLLDNNFLLHQLHSLKRQIEKDAYGGAQPNISSKKIEEMEIVLPTLDTQQAIVSKIEELFSELDKGIEDLKTAQQQLKTYRQSVLKWAFEGKLTEEWRRKQDNLLLSQIFISETNKSREINYNKKLEEWKKIKINSKEEKVLKPQKPSNLDSKNELFEGLIDKKNLTNEWEIVPLVFVSDNLPNSIVDGPFGSSINVNEDYINEGVPVVRMINIRPLKFINKNLKFIKDSKFQSLKRHNIVFGDILIAKVGATIGDCCIYPNLPEAMLSTTGSCRVRIDKNVINSKFLEYYIFFHRNTLKDIASQTAQPFLNMKVVKSFPIVLPTINEQHVIVQEIESRFSVADKMEESIAQSLQQAEALRQSILKKAFSGELV